MRKGEVKLVLNAQRLHKGKPWEIGSQDIQLKAKSYERETYFTTEFFFFNEGNEEVKIV